MKKLYIIGGTMGVGKTAVCQLLKRKMDKSVFLDGDWCWDSHPFQVTEETKDMVMRNICFLLNQFIHCSAYQSVIFCWVMHEQGIIDAILESIDQTDCCIKTVSLICGEAELRARLARDVEAGIRTADVIERSAARLPGYAALHTVKIDTGGKSADEVAAEIMAL